MIPERNRFSEPSPRSGAVFQLAGPGFHTGRPNRLTLSGGLDGTGKVRIGQETWTVWGTGSDPSAQGRCTLSHGIGPIEHLSAAALCAGSDGWILEAEHADLPIFDGSARIWSEAFVAIGASRNREPMGVSAFGGGKWFSSRGGILEAAPSDKFRLRVEWSKGSDGPEVWEGDAKRLSNVLDARTFVDVDDWLQARKADLLMGTDAGSGRLLRGINPTREALDLALELGVDPADSVWTGGAERLPGECAAHKAMDLAGDIGCWIGYLPKLSILARDAGHDLHHQLGLALRESIGKA